MAKHFDFDDELNETKSPKAKQSNTKKTGKKLKLKKWRVVTLGIILFVIIFFIYIIFSTRESGPVYGDRCKGLITIKENVFNNASASLKKKYDEIKTINFEIACKEIKIDIDFKKGTSTSKAKKIAKASIEIVDKLQGENSVSGSDYSELFNTKNKVKQYEVDFYLTTTSNEDFPIYGSKMAGKDKVNFTLSSIKDNETYKEATGNQ